MQGNIQYDINRTRIHEKVALRQYVLNGKTSAKRGYYCLRTQVDPQKNCSCR